LTFGNEWYFELFLSENLSDFAGIVTHISKNIINLQPKITKITPFSKMSTEPRLSGIKRIGESLSQKEEI